MKLNAKELAYSIIVAVIVIVIAIELLPIVFTASLTAVSNTTIANNSHFAPALSLVYLIPLVFVAGLLVLIIFMMFGEKE